MFSQSTQRMHGNQRLTTEISISILCTLLFGYLFFGWSQSPLITALDRGFFALFGDLTKQSWAVDTLIVNIFITNTVRIAPLLACLVWLAIEHRRKGLGLAFLGCTLLGSFFAMALSRVMQNFSAFRPRPLHEPDLVYQLPHGIRPTVLEGWSSFPSDTSALAFAIAAGLFLASRRLGVVAFLWAAVIVAFPRAYGGLHYPSDLIGGALIGVFSTLGAAPLILRATLHRINLSIADRWVPLLWTLAFLYLYQMGTMFDDVRAVGTFAKTVLGF